VPAAPEVVVRTARASDAPRLVELLIGGSLAGGQEDPSDLAPYQGALAEIEATAPGGVLVAERLGQVVGVCQLLIFRHLQHRGGRCAEVESLHVHPDHRSEGIGGVLLEEAVRRAVEAGCYRIQLTSNLARTEAHRFYERHGFVPSHQGFKRLLD
jgi:GNAT superfamily N-acetyltransferase